MKKTYSLFFLGLASVLVGSAAPCGTVASPTSCIVNVGGTVQYEFSNFQLLNSVNGGGGLLYTGSDININVGTGGGLSGLLTFTKNPDGPAPNTVFFVNAGQTSGFTFSYTATITALQPGTVNFLPLATVSVTSSHANNGLGSDQLVVAPVSCQATSNAESDDCTLTGVTNTFLAGNLIALSGNSGNVSFLNFSNLFNAEFTAETPTPEPSTFALLGVGLLALKLSRRR